MKYTDLLLSIGLFSCGDSYRSVTQGPAGLNGTDGTNGTQGVSGDISLISITRFTSDTTLCPSGSGILVKSGIDDNGNEILDNTEVTQASVVCDGETGATGAAGSPAPVPQYQVVAFITPCPEITTPYREVLFRLANGTILGSFSDNLNGLNTRLALIPPGSYVDSDDSGCNFSVDAGNSLTDQYGNVFKP